MECTICGRKDLKLNPIEADMVSQHNLCDNCLSDLFTKDFNQELSSESDNSTHSFEAKADFGLDKEFHLDHQNESEYSDKNITASDSMDFPVKLDNIGINKEATKLKEICVLCGERTTNRRSLSTHMLRHHPEDKIHRCHICRQFFKGIRQFEEHIQSEHSGFSKICSICLEGYDGEKGEHEKTCLGRLVFECFPCSQLYVSKEGLTKHLETHQIAEELECSTYEEKRSHIKIQTCVLCDDDQGYDENTYWNHIHKMHDGRHLRCTDCGKTFRNRKHMIVHQGVQCKMGAKAQERATKLQAIVESQCQFCAKIFRNRSLLQNHVTKIHRAKPVVCDLCGLSLANRNQMRYHKIKSHTDPKEKCPRCPKQFHLPSDLRQHLTTHDELGKFICEECGRVFKRKVGLEQHIKSHIRDSAQPNRRMVPGSSGKHACELCDRRFKHKYVLLAHKRIHDPNRVLEKKYNCKECDQKFATTAGLFYHMRGKYVHQKITCSSCSAVIKGKVRYEEHLAMHSNE